MKKMTALLTLAALILALAAAPIAAAEPDSLTLDRPAGPIQPMFVYINWVDTLLAIRANDLAECSASVICSSTAVDRIVIYMYLQTYSGGTWTTVGSWSQTFYSNTATLYKVTYAPPGYTYRVKGSYYVYSGAQSEHVVDYSNTVIR